jgi:hypothetical protein
MLLAVICTGLDRFTCCQPLEVSLVNVTAGLSNVPEELHRRLHCSILDLVRGASLGTLARHADDFWHVIKILDNYQKTC